ncbi:MAG: hypothetical protein KC493_09425 [Bacteriovoracaceae bacterium]|nr:hypothetical protein [Bacteriovoracaceae bacterium]
MRTNLLAFLLTFFLLVPQAFALPDAFQKRFKFVKKDGKLVEVRDRSLTAGFSIRPYIKFIKENLKKEQALMNSKSDYFEEVELLLEEDFKANGEKGEDVQIIIESLKALRDIDVDAIFNNSKFKEFITKFESKMSDALNALNPFVLARLDNSSYFYKRAVTYQVVKWGLDLAKRIFSSVPVLNTASYVLVKVEKLIREKRTFHQNMLMHYLENHESEIGLEKEEVDLVYSSIQESRIPWYAFWESNLAKQSWDKYGINKFYANVRVANTRLRSNRGRYSRSGKRLNYAFQEVTEKNEDVIINLFNNQDMFNSKPAVAYNLNNPQKIARKRMIFQLAGLGLSFLSLPQWIKDIANGYIKSHYEAQKITEGALFGYFESQEDVDMQREIIKQYQNPFDINLIL